MGAFGVVVLLWLAVFPFTPFHPDVLWSAHLFAVATALLALVPRLWRTRRLTAGTPALLVGLMGLSLLVAVLANREGSPTLELDWIALTGVAHAVFFGACLFAAPSPYERGAEQDEAVAGRWRRLLVLLLVVILAGQVIHMLGDRPALDSDIEAAQADPGSDAASDAERDPDGDSEVEVEDTAWRPAGTLGSPNALGTVLAAGGLALLALARFRPAALVLALPLVLALLATRSRGAVLSLGVVVAVLLWRRFGSRALALFAAVGLLLVLVPNPLRDRVAAMQPEHAFSRAFIWGRAAEAITTAPLGIGPGMNKYVFPKHAWNAEHPWLLHQRHAVGLTHNVFLTVTLEWGWLAGLALVALTVWVARRLFARGPPDPLRLAATLGAAVLFVELQVDGLEQQPTAFGLFLLLAATALARTPMPPRGLALSGKLAAVGAVLVAAALAVPAAGRIAIDDAFRRLEPLVEAQAAGELELDELRAAFAAVAAIEPSAPRPWRRWLRFEKERIEHLLAAPASSEPEATADALVDDELVAHVIDGALLANPRDRQVLRQAAELRRRLYHREPGQGGGDPADLQAYFELTEALLTADPLDVEVRFALASEAHRVGNPELRDRALAAVFELEPDYAWAWYTLARVHETAHRPEQSLYAYVRALEAYANCALKIKVDSPRSRAFYQRNLDRVDPKRLWKRIAALRREVYF